MTSVFQRPYTERDGSEFQVYDNVTIEYRDKSHRYWTHSAGERTPAISVTSVLKILDKPALIPWAERAGAEGAIRLEREGTLQNVPIDQVIDFVRMHKVGADAKRDAGADRGTAVHNTLELWAREQIVPDLADFPGEVRGYVQGLCSWLLDARPIPSSMERFVGSVTYGYAGRLDLRATLKDGRDCVVDLKSSPTGRIYPEAHAQTRAYEMAEIECGNPKPDGLVIVGVGADGSYTQVECEARSQDWLSILGCHRAMAHIRSGIKLTEKAA